jgi:type II secretory pathway pseudopilin PulG
MAPRSTQRQRVLAFSLLETVIALGVLVSGFAVFFRLYHVALNYAGGAHRKAVAANVAQRQLVNLRGWAAQPKAGGGYNFDDWTTTPTDVSLDDEDHPEYRVRIQTAFTTGVSPNSRLVVGPVGFEQKSLEATFRKVQITVTWARESLEIVSLVADPTRRLRPVGTPSPSSKPVEITGPSGVVARDAPVNLSLKVFDSDGREIPDVMAKWYVKPINGVGQVSNPIEGATATFVNVSEKMDGTPQYTGGQCRVTARVVYRGEEAWGESEILDLAP